MAQFDIYEFVNDKLISQMENGIIPWLKPWTRVQTGKSYEFCLVNARKYRSGELYSLMNQFLLGEDGVYLSFKEVKDAGGKVKKGAKAKTVVFWKIIQKDRVDENGKPVMGKDGKPIKDSIPLLRYKNVFSLNDTEGVPEKKWMHEQKPAEINTGFEHEPIEQIEKILRDYIEREGIEFTASLSNEAYYRPFDDSIHIPMISQFPQVEEYYSTWAHECTHSTGHSKRLNRLKMENLAARGVDYSKEELVAEIGAASILSICGIDTAKTIRNSTAYLQGWLTHLKNDKKMLISAAGKAEKAINMILNIQNQNKEGENEDGEN